MRRLHAAESPLMRTLVVADPHGYASSLVNALEHAKYTGDDQLIIAGDLLDGGSDDVVAMADELGATVLVGNHEVSGALGLAISPQDPQTLERGDELRSRILSGEWSLAAAVDGWLVTHAGVSDALDDVVSSEQYDPERIAARLNAMLIDEVRRIEPSIPVDWDDLARYRLLGGNLGPLWFRPQSAELLPSGLQQIVGHTPPELLGSGSVGRYASHGWLFIDSGGHGPRRPAYRYAQIIDGSAEVISAEM